MNAQQHIEFAEKALSAIAFMLSVGNTADAKRYVFALIESGIQRTEAQETRLNALFAACYGK